MHFRFQILNLHREGGIGSRLRNCFVRDGEEGDPLEVNVSSELIVYHVFICKTISSNSLWLL